MDKRVYSSFTCGGSWYNFSNNCRDHTYINFVRMDRVDFVSFRVIKIK